MSLTTVAPLPQQAPASSPAKAWLRALELTAPIVRNPQRLLSDVIDEQAEVSPGAPALLSSREQLTYRALSGRVNQYTRWALRQVLVKATRSRYSCRTARNMWPSGWTYRASVAPLLCSTPGRKAPRSRIV